MLLYTAMHKTLLLSSKGSRLRKHMGTRQKLSLSRLALAMSAVRSAAELPRGAEAFAPRPESFLLSVHRTTVADAGDGMMQMSDDCGADEGGAWAGEDKWG